MPGHTHRTENYQINRINVDLQSNLERFWNGFCIKPGISFRAKQTVGITTVPDIELYANLFHNMSASEAYCFNSSNPNHEHRGHIKSLLSCLLTFQLNPLCVICAWDLEFSSSSYAISVRAPLSESRFVFPLVFISLLNAPAWVGGFFFFLVEWKFLPWTPLLGCLAQIMSSLAQPMRKHM